MTALPAPLNPLGQYLNLAGTGLNQGHIWIGLENEDPESSPAPVYWDSLGLYPAEQPLNVMGGYIYRDGQPAPFYVSGAFSIRARAKSLDTDPTHGPLVFYLPSVSNPVSTVTSGAWPFPMILGDLDDASPTSGQWLGGIAVPWAMQLPTNLYGAIGQVFFPPASNWTASLRLNSTGEDATTGTEIATMTIHTDGTFVFSTTDGLNVDLPAGSHIDWYAPISGEADTSIKGIKWTWLGYVQGDGSGAYANVVTQPELDAATTELQEQIDDINTALALKAPLDSPALTGTPTAPTAARGTATTQLATTAFVADATSLAALAAVFTQSLGADYGMITLPGGVCFQWKTEEPGDDTYTVYALPTPFTDKFYGAVATVVFNDDPPKTGGNGGGAYAYPESLSHIGLGIAWDGDASGISKVFYFAVGKMALP